MLQYLHKSYLGSLKLFNSLRQYILWQNPNPYQRVQRSSQCNNSVTSCRYSDNKLTPEDHKHADDTSNFLFVLLYLFTVYHEKLG
jgi:hypothetical protein